MSGRERVKEMKGTGVRRVFRGKERVKEKRGEY